MPRPQFHEFAQYLLPEEALLAPEATWDTLRAPASGNWLAELWAQAHRYANTPAAPIPATGLLAEQSIVGTHEAVLIEFPAVEQVGEPWLALLVRTPTGTAPFRYFLLEAAPDPAGGADGQRSVIVERQADADVRRTHGAGPDAPSATLGARFIVAVARILAPERPHIPNPAA